MRKIDKNEFNEIYEHHQIWLKTNGADGKQADFTNCDLSAFLDPGYCFSGKNFSYADFTAANISGQILIRTNFTGAVLIDADMRYCNFSNAIFKDARLLGANIAYAKLGYVDLRDVASLLFEITTNTKINRRRRR